MWLHPDIQSSTFSVSAGDRLLFYTDGLLEARDPAGRYFRLEDCLDTLRYPDLQAAVDGLLDRLLAHAGRKLHDDVVLLLLEATSPPVRPGQDMVPECRPLSVAGTGVLAWR
jgi:serine phosphatase RsbU (regulator of sigma subunit)